MAVASDLTGCSTVTLTALLRRAFTRDHAAQAAVEAVQEGDRDAAQELAGYLVDHAGRNHEFGCELQAWIADTRQTLNIGDNFNIISGGDIGKAIQARDVGSITM
ncbi:MAG: hypothetical protein WCF33_05410 [Pseudonocardiaceae bacterium]